MKSKLYCYCTILIALCMVGCSKEEGNKELYNPMNPNMPFVSGKSSRTIFAYMAGDNDLSEDIGNEIDDMAEGMKKTSSSNNLICLVDRHGNNTQILKVLPNDKKVIYDYGENRNSSDPKLFRDAFEYIRSNYPNESYGLILSDHGSGWLPCKSTTTKSFGGDETSKDEGMNLEHMVEALKDYHFDFIIFDACLMASVELMYELRGTTDYFLVSSMTTKGFPLNDIAPYLFVDKENIVDGLKSIAYYYRCWYENHSENYTISLIDSKGFEQLKNEAKKLGVTLDSTLRNKVQKFDTTHPVYDFLDAYTKASPSKDVNGLKQQVESMVLYNEYTERIDKTTLINTCCGITSFIYGNDEEDGTEEWYNKVYEKTSWYKDTHASSSKE